MTIFGKHEFWWFWQYLLTPIQENSIYKKQGPSPISLVRATRIFSKAKTLKKIFDLSLAIGDNPIYPFWDAHGQAG
jgi:hypothetical protein